MPNFLTEHERKRLISRLRLQRELQQRGADSHPKLFRNLVTLAASESVTLQNVIQPWQETDFTALDSAWLTISGRVVNSQHDSGNASDSALYRAYLERPRGHSKTTDLAVQIAWILQYARHSVTGIAAAADRDQAGLLVKAIAELIRRNPTLCPDLVARQTAIVNQSTGSRLDVISSDVRSSWGQLPDFVICDELCHWEKVDLWHSLISSAAKKPKCLLVVLTNAGVGTGWQWDVREAARTSPEWHFSSLTGPRAPWISPAALDEQRRLLPPSVYARLWENVWQQTEGEFVTLAEAEACRVPEWIPHESGQRGFSYIAAIDYAEKHDRTVGVVIHREQDRIVVDRMDVAVPERNQPIPVRWVEEWIAAMGQSFQPVRFVLDEYQLVGTLQKLSSRWPMKRFQFSGGKGNHILAIQLRHLIVQKQLVWYPGCGQIPNHAGRDDLETELASLILRTTSTGRVRIDHRRDGNHHDDRAFALGAACMEALQDDPTSEFFEVWNEDYF